MRVERVCRGVISILVLLRYPFFYLFIGTMLMRRHDDAGMKWMAARRTTATPPPEFKGRYVEKGGWRIYEDGS